MCNSALDQGRGEQAIIDVAAHRARVRLLKLDARGPTAVLTEIDMTRGPMAAGPTAFTVGSTWTLQFFHRDPAERRASTCPTPCASPGRRNRTGRRDGA